MIRKQHLKNFLRTILTLIPLYFFFFCYNRHVSNTRNLEAIFQELFNVSKANKIKDEIILQTIDFMIREVDEFDPKLIDFVKTLIHKPSGKPLNLVNKQQNLINKDFSQIGQSPFMDSLLKNKMNGFFIEAGAFEGESLSNSLYFELTRNWTGILIEPVPSFHSTILTKNRNVYSINACIAKNRPIVNMFKVSSALSGRSSQMSEGHLKRITSNYEIIYVPCFSLNTILKAIGVKQVDYFSLDVEGGEWDVLTSLDYKRIDFVSFTIEHNGETDRRDLMINFLKEKNYLLAKKDGQDIYLIKEGY